jgi:hypothetical protein
MKRQTASEGLPDAIRGEPKTRSCAKMTPFAMTLHHQPLASETGGFAAQA